MTYPSDLPPAPVIPPAAEPPPPGVKRTVTAIQETRDEPIPQKTPFSRKVEDGGFLAAIVLVSLWCLNAILKSAGYIIGPCRNLDDGFPWEFVILCAVLVVPKTIGRRTAGKIWGSVASRGQPPEVP